MKKIALTIAIVLGLGLTTFADPNGSGLFQRGIVSDEEYYGTGYYDNWHRSGLLPPGLPGHNAMEDQDAPLGSGIAVLLGLSGAYLVAKKRREK